MKKVFALMFAASMFVFASCEKPAEQADSSAADSAVIEEPVAPVEEEDAAETDSIVEEPVADDSLAN